MKNVKNQAIKLEMPTKNEWDLIQKIIEYLDNQEKAIIHAIYDGGMKSDYTIWGIIRFRRQNYWVQKKELGCMLEILEDKFDKTIIYNRRKRQIYVRNEPEFHAIPEFHGELPF